MHHPGAVIGHSPEICLVFTYIKIFILTWADKTRLRRRVQNIMFSCLDFRSYKRIPTKNVKAAIRESLRPSLRKERALCHQWNVTVAPVWEHRCLQANILAGYGGFIDRLPWQVSWSSEECEDTTYHDISLLVLLLTGPMMYACLTMVEP